MDSAYPKTTIMTIFSTKSMILKFAKELFTLGIFYKVLPDPESTLPEGLLPDLLNPTRGIDTSLTNIIPLKTMPEQSIIAVFHPK